MLNSLHKNIFEFQPVSRAIYDSTAGTINKKVSDIGTRQPWRGRVVKVISFPLVGAGSLVAVIVHLAEVILLPFSLPTRWLLSSKKEQKAGSNQGDKATAEQSEQNDNDKLKKSLHGGSQEHATRAKGSLESQSHEEARPETSAKKTDDNNDATKNGANSSDAGNPANRAPEKEKEEEEVIEINLSEVREEGTRELEGRVAALPRERSASELIKLFNSWIKQQQFSVDITKLAEMRGLGDLRFMFQNYAKNYATHQDSFAFNPSSSHLSVVPFTYRLPPEVWSITGNMGNSLTSVVTTPASHIQQLNIQLQDSGFPLYRSIRPDHHTHRAVFTTQKNISFSAETAADRAASGLVPNSQALSREINRNKFQKCEEAIQFRTREMYDNECKTQKQYEILSALALVVKHSPLWPNDPEKQNKLFEFLDSFRDLLSLSNRICSQINALLEKESFTAKEVARIFLTADFTPYLKTEEHYGPIVAIWRTNEGNDQEILNKSLKHELLNKYNISENFYSIAIRFTQHFLKYKFYFEEVIKAHNTLLASSNVEDEIQEMTKAMDMISRFSNELNNRYKDHKFLFNRKGFKNILKQVSKHSQSIDDYVSEMEEPSNPGSPLRRENDVAQKVDAYNGSIDEWINKLSVYKKSIDEQKKKIVNQAFINAVDKDIKLIESHISKLASSKKTLEGIKEKYEKQFRQPTNIGSTPSSNSHAAPRTPQRQSFLDRFRSSKTPSEEPKKTGILARWFNRSNSQPNLPNNSPQAPQPARAASQPILSADSPIKARQLLDELNKTSPELIAGVENNIIALGPNSP